MAKVLFLPFAVNVKLNLSNVRGQTSLNIFTLNEGHVYVFPNFQNCTRCKNTRASIWGENMLGYLSANIVCSEKLAVFII